MAEKGEAELGVVVDATQSPVGVIGGLVDGIRAKIGEVGSLEGFSDLFDRVKVVGLGS